jgi:eukaryotic-like serine/threonine-protein kinase
MTENGDIYLVDFGSVQDVVRSELEHGSTFVGTPGYTPIEQFQGQATPRSDLYAIAATMVFLLTHREVTDFTSDGLVIDVTQFAQSKGLRAVLANYLDPDVRKRTLSPENALLILQGKMEPVREEKRGAISEAFMSMLEEVKRASSRADMSIDRDIRKDPGLPPPGSLVTYSSDKNHLEITIPAGTGGNGGMGAFALIWNAFIFVFSAVMISSGFGAQSLAPFLPFFLFLIPFWGIGIGIGYAALFNRFGKTSVHLERDRAGTVVKEFIIKRSKVFDTEHVSECEISVAYTSNNSPVYQCKLVTPRKGFSFGQKLSNAEKKWICNTVNYWINQRTN